MCHIPHPVCASIIWVHIFDPNDENPKIRPAIVLEVYEDEERFLYCGITTKLPSPLTDMYYKMESTPRMGHRRSGLKQECAARCDWVFEESYDIIENPSGYMTNFHFEELLEQIENHRPPAD